MWQLHAADIGGIFHYARAVLAKWGQPAQARAGAVPLDEARRLFDAGWKAAALLCDREDVVADGIIGFGACPQFEAAFSAAQPVAREPLTDAMVSRAGRALSDVYATECGVDKEDNWKIYGSDFIETARLVLEAAHDIKGGQHGTDT